MPKQQLAFVLGGGGARGALQVGALRALQEAGYHPDLLVGTSIGALNAAFLGLHGFNAAALAELATAWQHAAVANLLPANYVWLTVRALLGRRGLHQGEEIPAFLAAHGITPELRFADLHGVPTRLVATDLNRGRSTLYGAAPGERVLDGVLASAALPPWVRPVEQSGRLLLDGGVVSNLPIEPALSQGATAIIALDIIEPGALLGDDTGLGAWLNKFSNTILQRQLDLELALAAAQRVPVRRLWLRFEHAVALWDFSHTEELMAAGYARAKAEITAWRPARPAPLRRWLNQWG